MNRWKKSRDNRGMSLVMVIGTVALVSILVVIVLSLSLMNIQMKSVYKKSADNFYDAEAAMDEIRTGLQQDVADAATRHIFLLCHNILPAVIRMLCVRALSGNCTGRS